MSRPARWRLLSDLHLAGPQDRGEHLPGTGA
jgi:hypothetical protein